jgi:hypothetical protein
MAVMFPYIMQQQRQVKQVGPGQMLKQRRVGIIGGIFCVPDTVELFEANQGVLVGRVLMVKLVLHETGQLPEFRKVFAEEIHLVHRAEYRRDIAALIENCQKRLAHMLVLQKVAIDQRERIRDELREVWIEAQAALLSVQEHARRQSWRREPLEEDQLVIEDVSIASFRGRPKRSFGQVNFQSLPKCYAGFIRLRCWVDSGLDLAHELSGSPSGLAQANAVDSIDLDPDGADPFRRTSPCTAYVLVVLCETTIRPRTCSSRHIPEPGSISRIRVSVRFITGIRLSKSTDLSTVRSSSLITVRRP